MRVRDVANIPRPALPFGNGHPHLRDVRPFLRRGVAASIIHGPELEELGALYGAGSPLPMLDHCTRVLADFEDARLLVRRRRIRRVGAPLHFEDETWHHAAAHDGAAHLS